MLSVLLSCWAVLTLHSAATCFHVRQTSYPATSGGADADPEAHQRLGRFTAKKDNGLDLKPVRRGSSNDRRERNRGCFSALNIHKPAFLCLDSRGTLYTSVFGSNEDCRFRRVKRHKRFVWLQSCRGGALLVHAGPRALTSPDLSDYVFLKPRGSRTSHRKRRSWHTDPSDPLGSEHPQLGTVRNWRSDPGHGGVVSKETMASVDDPLQVLLSHNAQTPTLEKHRENRRFRF